MRGKIAALLCLFCAAFAALLAGCSQMPGPAEIRVMRADFSKPVEAKVGDLVVAVLKANKTTGYSWACSAGGRQVVLEAEKYELPERGAQPVCGAGGKQIFMFRCVNAGAARVDFFYRRPWEAAPIDSASLKIKVD